MALRVELLKRLNSDEEPLTKRLKLAENTLHATDIPIVRKDDFILQWLCNTYPMDQEVWDTLNNCLKIKYLDIKNAVKKKLIDTLIETFQKDIKHIHNGVFECCSLIASNNEIQQYFISKPENLGLFTKSLLECVYKIFKHAFSVEKQPTEARNMSLIDKCDRLMLQAYNTTINVMENIVQIFKSTSTTKDNLSTIFIHSILYPLCAIIDHNCTDSTNRLGIISHMCIKQLILGRKHVQNREFLKDKDIIRLKNLLSILTENAKAKNFQSNLTTFTFFFRVAISAFKSNTVVLDIILRELVESSGIYRKEILNSLLKHLNDLTFDFDNKIHDVALFDYCQNIVNDILICKSMSNTDYNLLVQFCYFNPLIIEKKIQDILKKAFIEKSTLEYKNLLISILDASVYLRQEEKLISSILIALKGSLHQIRIIEANTFFPHEFKEKLMNVVSNVTNSQSIIMLRTLVYYLKTDCLEMLHSNVTYKNILIFQASVELLTTLLDGICIFEYSGAFVSYKKFMNTFTDLKNVLSLLMDKILFLNYDEQIFVILLTAIFSWNQAQRALKYYVPKSVSEDLKLLISENQWQQLIKKVADFGNENCKNSMNKLILQQTTIFQNISSESSIIFKNLIGGLEYCWSNILKFDTGVISTLSNEQVSNLTYLLLTDMTSNVNNFNEWVKVLHKDNLQENKRLIVFLLSHIFAQIGHLATGVTKLIAKHFNAKFLVETEIVEDENINKILISIKEELLVNKWIQIQDTFLCKIKVHLEVLLHLPLMFLSTNLSLITFMFIFALRMETDQNNEIVFLCNTIFLDLLERSSIDVFQYINPSLLLQQLPHNKIIQKTLELFLRSCSYAVLKELIKSSADSNKNMFFLLTSMQYVKSKLNVDQKTMIKKAEKKLIKSMVTNLPSKLTKAEDVKILNLVLRISITNENINEKLKDVAESTILNIFVDDRNENTANELLEDSLQLVVVILHNKKIFQITNQSMRGIWYTLFKYPCIDVLLPLLGSSEPKELYEFLEQLHNQLIKTLLKVQENDLENICIIWNTILKTNMSNDRNKLRLTAINNLIQIIQTVKVPEKFWPNLLKLIQNILVTKHLYLPDYIIDMSIFLCLKSLEGNIILTCNDTLILCNILLKMETSLITDRIPALLILYRRILSVVVHKSKDITNKSEEHTIKCLMLDIEKFTSSLIKLKKDMIRISPYLVADLLELFSENLITSFAKASLQNCINQMISICDQHGIALLSRTLPVSMQEIFKTQLDIYNKFYKFSGKI
ncbi:PREDICTED: uncharacterized protein LOC108580138 [Habropoda laboriosa]|uniref:uncharacterized protein LOC108580138 n=1 Tax=Habropoda laboriosa TaxID=597456 RepID=UPI00083CB32E|nr:PREDICTED: uncharacterized protein LOC108580138 [Habropoda laboriosa]